MSRRCFLGYFSARVPPRFAIFCLQKKCVETHESRCYAGHKMGTCLHPFCTCCEGFFVKHIGFRDHADQQTPQEYVSTTNAQSTAWSYMSCGVRTQQSDIKIYLRRTMDDVSPLQSRCLQRSRARRRRPAPFRNLYTLRECHRDKLPPDRPFIERSFCDYAVLVRTKAIII